jgi:hypothetical protein
MIAINDWAYRGKQAIITVQCNTERASLLGSCAQHFFWRI